jgi:uncharacterized protein (DUF2141 family)
MNIRLKIALSVIAGVLLSILISQCKSPAPKVEETTATQADTARVDTAKTIAAPVSPQIVSHTPLTLVIKNLASPNAPIIVGLYGIKNKFPDPKDQLKEYHFTPNGLEYSATIADMEFGIYALAIYQDVNSNGKIDKNMMGIPTEPYAFSNNYHPRIKAPNFGDCKFNYDSTSNTVTMSMIK